MNIGIYIVYDLVAKTILGGLQLHKHHAPAIRTFVDALTTPGSLVAAHPADFELRLIGYINDTHTLTPQEETIITGSQWLATQPPTQ